MAKKVPEFNAAPMADIAFLLLIFFLVATTMNIDTGLTRKLPPLPEDQKQQQDDKKIKERNVFEVLINSNDQLLVEGEPMKISSLRESAKEFISNPQNKDNLPEMTEKEFPEVGVLEVPKNHIISLQNDRGTSYEMYLHVQNELVAAYNELRNEIATRKFGKKFEELSGKRQKAIKEAYPQVISEAEPKNVGGN
jgi:biopolymer transport protein ExbD